MPIVVLSAAPWPRPVTMAPGDVCMRLISLAIPRGTALSHTASDRIGCCLIVTVRTSCVGMRAALSRVKKPSRIRFYTAPTVMGALDGVCTHLLSGL